MFILSTVLSQRTSEAAALQPLLFSACVYMGQAGPAFDSISNSPHQDTGDFLTGPPLKVLRKVLSVPWTIYINVDLPNLGFAYSNF